jgi:hypothetical protein
MHCTTNSLAESDHIEDCRTVEEKRSDDDGAHHRAKGGIAFRFSLSPVSCWSLDNEGFYRDCEFQMNMIQ